MSAVTRSRRRVVTTTHRLTLGMLLVLLSAGMGAHAAQFGHARMTSAAGTPLSIDVSVRDLSPDQADQLQVRVAPVQAWQQAGLTPPVALDSLQFQLVDGVRAGTYWIQARSAQVFHGQIADLLLETQTGTQRQTHQVSVMAPGGQAPTIRLATGAPSSASVGAAVAAGRQAGALPAGAIRVQRGDTLFSLARSHAVPGVSVYQMMMALQALNPDAFINGNVNRLKAGASLHLPQGDQLTQLSDAEARRLFHEQGEAFAAYRARLAGQPGDAMSANATQGRVSDGQADASPVTPTAQRDQLVLSSPDQGDAAADQRLADDKNIAESQGRIAELEQNVAGLQAALQQTAQAGDTGSSAAAAPDAANVQGTSQAAAVSTPSGAASANHQPETAVAEATSQAQGSGSSQAASPATGIAVPGQADANVQAAHAASTAAGASDAQSPASSSTQTSWLQRNMLGVVTGILALLVLLVVWFLRRAGAHRTGGQQGSPITEEMVKQKLDEISLSLDETLSDDSANQGGKSA